MVAPRPADLHCVANGTCSYLWNVIMSRPYSLSLGYTNAQNYILAFVHVANESEPITFNQPQQDRLEPNVL